MPNDTRSSSPRAHSEPLDDFIASLQVVERQATKVEKLPRRRLLEALSAGKDPRAQARALLRHIGTITRRFEQIRQNLQDEELTRIDRDAERLGTERLQRLVQEGALLEPVQFAERLGWSRQALSKALAAHRVFYVECQGSRYYPSFFADPRYERRHVESVSKCLADLPGAAKLQFMTTPKGSLDARTPLQALAAGQLARVKAAAEAFAEG